MRINIDFGSFGPEGVDVEKATEAYIRALNKYGVDDQYINVCKGYGTSGGNLILVDVETPFDEDPNELYLLALSEYTEV